MELSPLIAYLDPGTGSMLLQLIIGFVVGVLYTIKLYWYKISSFLGLGKPDQQKECVKQEEIEDEND